MPKRATLIITDADRILGKGYEGDSWTIVGDIFEYPSEQLLADLRTLADECLHGDLASVRDAAARLRALLPEETQDGE